jgi:hypothetical protein
MRRAKGYTAGAGAGLSLAVSSLVMLMMMSTVLAVSDWRGLESSGLERGVVLADPPAPRRPGSGGEASPRTGTAGGPPVAAAIVVGGVGGRPDGPSAEPGERRERSVPSRARRGGRRERTASVAVPRRALPGPPVAAPAPVPAVAAPAPGAPAPVSAPEPAPAPPPAPAERERSRPAEDDDERRESRDAAGSVAPAHDDDGSDDDSDRGHGHGRRRHEALAADGAKPRQDKHRPALERPTRPDTQQAAPGPSADDRDGARRTRGSEGRPGRGGGRRRSEEG